MPVIKLLNLRLAAAHGTSTLSLAVASATSTSLNQHAANCTSTILTLKLDAISSTLTFQCFNSPTHSEQPPQNYLL
jgi:hypothetical protein